MKEGILIKFIESSSKEQKDLLLTNTIDKAKYLNKESNMLSIFMIILILIYYFSDDSFIRSIQIGPIQFDNISTYKYFIPLVFSYILFRYMTISSHVAELKLIIKSISKKYFLVEDDEDSTKSIDDFSRLLLPYSIYDELGKFSTKREIGCITVILILPLFVVVMIPHLFLISCVINSIYNFTQMNNLQLVISISTVWFLLLSMLYFYKTLRRSINESKAIG